MALSMRAHPTSLRLVSLGIFLAGLGREEAAVAADSVLHVFAAQDTACAGPPLHSYPVAVSGHFNDAPQAGAGDDSEPLVHFRCTGTRLVASVSPDTDLYSLASDEIGEVADGRCMRADVTAEAIVFEGASPLVNIQLSERLLLPRKTGCPRGSAALAARLLAGKGGGGGGAPAPSGGLKKKKPPPKGPGEFFGAVLLTIFMSLFCMTATGLLVLNKLIGHKFVAPSAENAKVEDSGD